MRKVLGLWGNHKISRTRRDQRCATPRIRSPQRRKGEQRGPGAAGRGRRENGWFVGTQFPSGRWESLKGGRWGRHTTRMYSMPPNRALRRVTAVRHSRGHGGRGDRQESLRASRLGAGLGLGKRAHAATWTGRPNVPPCPLCPLCPTQTRLGPAGSSPGLPSARHPAPRHGPKKGSCDGSSPCPGTLQTQVVPAAGGKAASYIPSF